MALTKEKKKEILGEVEKIAKESKTVVFVNFHGLKVADSTQIRRKLKSEEIGFFVAKKTLIKRAFDANKPDGIMPELDGELGLAYGKDLISPAREIHEFTKKYKNSLAILGGVFDGKYLTQSEMMDIALIPPLKILQGMFVNIINSPIQGLVIALSEITKTKN
ncbi:MAG: 50S ribosomal protein L10 [Patescibacteria group bacterium]|nr:50S ribosomal protein L10 [Patescibacteria group bacterium]